MPELTPAGADVLAVCMGLIAGSFLNVVIARLPEGESLAWPGSHCPECKAPIRWFDNIPLLSFIALRGRCRACRCKISARYPVVEFITATLFLAAVARFGWSLALVLRDLPFIAILVAIAFIDLDIRIIPDSLSVGGLAWGLLTTGLFAVFPSLGEFEGGTAIGWLPSLVGAAVGYALFWTLSWAYYAVKKREGLGGGDVKLLAMIGAFLGLSGILDTILVSSVLGSVVGISWALIQRRSRDESIMLVSIPYGPFLVVGGLYHYFLSDLLWFRFMNPM